MVVRFQSLPGAAAWAKFGSDETINPRFQCDFGSEVFWTFS
jgi:hypothetical protein